MQPTQGQGCQGRLTSTLLLAEKRMNISHLGKMQAHDNEGYTCGWNHDTCGYTERQPLPDFQGVLGDLGGDRFGGPHPGVMAAVMADNSVHFISYDISLTRFRRLGHRRMDGRRPRFRAITAQCYVAEAPVGRRGLHGTS